MGRNRYEIRVKRSDHLAKFLTQLKSIGTKMTALTTYSDGTVFLTDRKGLRAVRKYRRRYRLKVSIVSIAEDDGLERIIGSYRFLIVLLIPFICSFFLWSVTVESEMPEVNERIEKRLQKASITPYRLLSMIPEETEVRRELMQQEPSLSWIHFNRSGTTLTVIPMLSPPLDQEKVEDGKPADLIAKTGGVVTRFELVKGERVARLYSTVQKGDILATGTLEQGEHTVVVGAEGAVFADYWMEYHFELPRVIDFKVQGDEEVSFSFKWPWKGKNLFNQENWNIIETEKVIQEKDASLEIKEGMEETVIIPLLKMKLLSEASSEAMIKEEKVLHVSFDDDKVKGTVLFFMNDNIAMKRPISQGD